MDIKRDKKVANLLKTIKKFVASDYPTYNDYYIGNSAKQILSIIKQAKAISFEDEESESKKYGICVDKRMYNDTNMPEEYYPSGLPSHSMWVDKRDNGNYASKRYALTFEHKEDAEQECNENWEYVKEIK